ncbi:MAG: DRTGG domain-containing protein [Anaerolineales bacterium]|nr:DRTGG domain-containing protein [Anaerolineales bacterium]MCX7754129.1 DRTGG domain-containing protein [Anaerolineales bacterium]MDW8278043.1 DRTGG domain-containing protein [Anaerolineales bacterium]
MNLQEIIHRLDLTPLTHPKPFESIHPTGGYASDLLSCVIAGAKPGNLWLTIQAHVNIVAVASLNELAAVIVTENASPDPAVIEKANEQGVTLLVSRETTYQVAGKLWEMGIR